MPEVRTPTSAWYQYHTEDLFHNYQIPFHFIPVSILAFIYMCVCVCVCVCVFLSINLHFLYQFMQIEETLQHKIPPTSIQLQTK
jgi:hypothetical protein